MSDKMLSTADIRQKILRLEAEIAECRDELLKMEKAEYEDALKSLIERFGIYSKEDVLKVQRILDQNVKSLPRKENEQGTGAQPQAAREPIVRKEAPAKQEAVKPMERKPLPPKEEQRPVRKPEVAPEPEMVEPPVIQPEKPVEKKAPEKEKTPIQEEVINPEDYSFDQLLESFDFNDVMPKADDEVKEMQEISASPKDDDWSIFDEDDGFIPPEEKTEKPEEEDDLSFNSLKDIGIGDPNEDILDGLSADEIAERAIGAAATDSQIRGLKERGNVVRAEKELIMSLLLLEANSVRDICDKYFKPVEVQNSGDPMRERYNVARRRIGDIEAVIDEASGDVKEAYNRFVSYPDRDKNRAAILAEYDLKTLL